MSNTIKKSVNRVPRRSPFGIAIVVFATVLTSRAAVAADVPAGKAGHWIVVVAPAFKDAIEPLKQRRAAEGFDVTVLTTTDVLTASEIRRGGLKLAARVRQKWHAAPANSYVLLVGTPIVPDGDDAAAIGLPMPPGTIGRMNGQPTDDPYGRAADDATPKVPVGRWPVRTVDEAKSLVDKTIAFEDDGINQAAWRRSITLLVGSPGGGSPEEKSVGNQFVGNSCRTAVGRIDLGWNVHPLCHIPTSSWYLPDGALHDESLATLRRGQSFVLHLGHSSADGFWSEGTAFVDRQDWQKLNMPHGAGVLMTCGCFACQYDPAGRGDHDGYGLAAVRSPGGSVAVIGATAESYSVAGYTAFNGLLPRFTAGHFPRRLGEAWLDVQNGIASGPVDFMTAKMLDYGDGSNGQIPLEIQRREHQQMWTLLGDPALKLPDVAADIPLRTPESVQAADAITLSGELPKGLRADHVHVQLERPANIPPADLTPIPKEPGPKRDAAILANFRKSQDVVISAEDVATHDGAFSAEVRLPNDAQWTAVVVRVIAVDGSRQAMGAMRVRLRH